MAASAPGITFTFQPVGRRGKRERDTYSFKGLTQMFYILLLLSSFWQELSHMVTACYKRGGRYSGKIILPKQPCVHAELRDSISKRKKERMDIGRQTLCAIFTIFWQLPKGLVD